ncbi:hypothetical protein FHW84_000684 [Dyella sp. SG562]|jgi:hypothetical protein|uniref:hypothetical protein n=1 Tax=Dyella TaxID=231454 RepID=UPI001422E60D|nr:MULTISPECIES: hypothetical protein [unclassified Dyella]NII72128.1 hypothetical protein [Dyella sp. SG562]NKJ23165.1 hypothetical protein [Dyella sp. SG609]
MRVAKWLLIAATTGVAGLFAGSVAAEPNCTVCLKGYQGCVNKDPNNAANIAACMAQYSTCLAWCGEPSATAAQRRALLDVRPYRPDLSATSTATALPPPLAPRAP